MLYWVALTPWRKSWPPQLSLYNSHSVYQLYGCCFSLYVCCAVNFPKEDYFNVLETLWDSVNIHRRYIKKIKDVILLHHCIIFLKMAIFLYLLGCNVTFSGFISQVDICTTMTTTRFSISVWACSSQNSGNLQVTALLQNCNLQISWSKWQV